jgi:undecaprenyl-diphosphatase
MEFLVAILLGLVEGVTEFLPVSSAGHLILTGHLLSFDGFRVSTFHVAIQLGAIFSVLVLYRKRFWGLFRTKAGHRFSGSYGIYLLILTSLPAVILGFVAHQSIKTYLFGPQTVAWALGTGAVAILVVESIRRTNRFTTLDQITPWLALGVGLFQCLALWPGFSRAAATILGAMILGADRKLAVEYSFIAAVPILLTATGFDLMYSWSFLQPQDLWVILVGFLVSFVSAMLAITLFMRLLSRTTLRPFAYYRLALVPLILLYWT